MKTTNYKYYESALNCYYDQIMNVNKFPNLSCEERRNLIRLAKLTKDDENWAKDRIIMAYTRLAYSIAKQYFCHEHNDTNNIPFEEFISAGRLGLIEAFESFDYNRNGGKGFVKYAIYRIHKEIVVGTSPKISLLKTSLIKNKEFQKSSKEKFYKRSGSSKQPDLDDNIIPFETFFSGTDDNTVIALISDKYSDSFYNKNIFDESLKNTLNDALAELTKREKNVIEMRFGLNGRRHMTLKQAGKEYSLSKERIKQIEDKAIAKLKGSSKVKKLKDYLSD